MPVAFFIAQWKVLWAAVLDRVREMPNANESACDLANAVFGALDDTSVELPGKCPLCDVDVALSCNAAPTMCWELLRNET